MRRGLLLLVLFGGLAVLHTWPLAGDLSGLSRLDNDDGGLNVFVISWVAHIVPRNPLALFEAPIFFPEHHTLAYSEHMLVPSMMGAPLMWAGVSPITVYNILVLAGFALSGWAMALVMTGWTGSTLGGVIAGMLYAFNAHLLTRLVHLQALHLEFFPLALLALDRLIRGSGGRRATVLLASAFVLQALCSNYTLVFMSVALLTGAAVRAGEWLWPPRPHTIAALSAAALVSIALLIPFLWPYYIVSREQGLNRPLDEVALYSATWADYLATGGRFHYALWSHRWFEGRTALFPGIAATLLACAAIAFPEVRRDRRVWMSGAAGLIGLALSFGPAMPGYAWIHEHVPLFTGLRGAARWGVLPLMAIAIIAGYTTAALQRRWDRSTYWPAAALILLAVPTLEALRTPMGFAGVPVTPAIYDGLRRADVAVLVEIPLYGGPSVSENARYMVAATHHFRPLVNGYSGFESAASRERAARWRAFPSAAVLEEMRAVGVTHVMVHTKDWPAEQVEAIEQSPELERVGDDAGLRLYTLRR
ncbi:MAG TPA: hypothetical protein VL263_21560 [Vicinamibacterales bacterium]|nr:hypothetical protein [Vicinamibacterales bacterium]